MPNTGRSPEELSRGRTVPDAELPMLAAQWLTQGYDSPLLRELAGLTRKESTEARQMLGEVLAELGHPIKAVDNPWDELPWRGYWNQIEWAIDQVDHTHTPSAAADRVLEMLSDVPDLWEPGGGKQLSALLERWQTERDRRDELDDLIRAHLRALNESDVPPLT